MIRRAGEGPVYPLEPGSLVRFKILTEETQGALEMYEREVPPQTLGADPHVHRTTIETFYVLEGRPTIQVGDVRTTYLPGSSLVVPIGAVHGFWNESDEPIRLLVTFTPGLHHHRFFEALSRLKAGPAETYVRDLAALREQFDSSTVF